MDASSYRHLYDAQSRMVRYEIGGTSNHVATNQYDALGRRIRELDGSVERRFLYIGDELAVVLRKQGSQAEQGYLYVAEPGGLTPIGRIRSTTGIPHEAFLHRDEQRSVVAVSTLNDLQPAAQSIEAGYPATAGPHTEIAEAAVGAYLGQPRMSDQGGGLVYMRTRFYDPNIGRFTQEDPIGFAGGLNCMRTRGTILPRLPIHSD